MAAFRPKDPVSHRRPAVFDVPKPNKVMSLKFKGDFLMHGVVLQNRVF